MLEGTDAGCVAAAGVGQHQQLGSVGVAFEAVVLPLSDQVVCGEVGGVVRGSHHHEAAVGAQVVDAVGDGDAVGLRAEVVVVDGVRRFRPAATRILEVADQFALLVSMLTIGRSHWANLVRCSEIWMNCWSRSGPDPVATRLWLTRSR